MTTPRTNTTKQRNFWIINTVNAVFFAGYLALKFPLAYMLASQGLSLSKAYSLTTTCTIGFAFCSLLLPLLLKNNPCQKRLFFLGVCFIFLSPCFLLSHILTEKIIGLSFYVIGGSVYFFNFTLLLNKQFETPKERLEGNYLSQIILNIGALFGCAIFVFYAEHPKHYFDWCIILTAAALLLLLSQYRKIEDHSEKMQSWMPLLVCNGLLFCFVFLCLQYNSLTRYLASILFSTGLICMVLHAYHHHEKGFFKFLALIFCFSLPYWISAIVVYNQFFVFLHSDVFFMVALPATCLILIDPLGNIIFGFTWHRLTRHFTPKPHINLTLGILLIMIAFGFSVMGISLHPFQKIGIFYPTITLFLFGCAQFLIQPTLHAQLSNLMAHHHNRIYALGLMRGIRGIAAVIAFYLIQHTLTTHTLPSAQNKLLYTHLIILSAVALLVFGIFSLAAKLR